MDAAKSLLSCPTLCDPIDSSPPGSPIPRILQARILEWVAISFSNAWKRKVQVKLLSRVQLLATSWTAAYQAPLSMGFSRQEYWSGMPLLSPQNGWQTFILGAEPCQFWKAVAEPRKTPWFLASRGEEFNLGPVMRLDHSELLCNKVLFKYKRDRESFWDRHQKGAERAPPDGLQANGIRLLVAVVFCSVVSDSLWPHGLRPARLLCAWDSPGKNTGVDCHSLLQRIFLTQGSNLGLLHCRQILYHLSYREEPYSC